MGRRMVRIWRWVLKRRPKSQPLTKKLIHWGRRLTKKLRCKSSHGGGDYYRIGGDQIHHHSGAYVPLLADVSDKDPPPPPKGHLAVYVGGRREGDPPQRYLVPVIYFNHPLFGELLREAEAEFGFQHPGGITIPCPVSRFERVKTRIDQTGSGRRSGAKQHC